MKTTNLLVFAVLAMLCCGARTSLASGIAQASSLRVHAFKDAKAINALKLNARVLFDAGKRDFHEPDSIAQYASLKVVVYNYNTLRQHAVVDIEDRAYFTERPDALNAIITGAAPSEAAATEATAGGPNL